jgi:hypothetical protein
MSVDRNKRGKRNRPIVVGRFELTSPGCMVALSMASPVHVHSSPAMMICCVIIRVRVQERGGDGSRLDR